MKSYLMYPDRDFDLEAKLPSNSDDLVQDLELAMLFDTMSGGDKFLREVARRAMLSSLVDPDEIMYRQDILRDCLTNPEVVRTIYRLATEAVEEQNKLRGLYFFGRSPGSILSSSVHLLEMLFGVLKSLSRIAKEHGGQFRSGGFVRFFDMLNQELDEEYFLSIQDHLRQLRFRNGVLLSASLGRGNKGENYVLRSPLAERKPWIDRVLGRRETAYSFEIADRDEAGHQALRELRDKGANLVANALAQSTDHIVSFFTLMRAELAFYVGCLNLLAELERKGEPTCIPMSVEPERCDLTARGLYDVCLTLTLEERAVGNDLAANHQTLVIITGANQGGKSTFLRSVGLAYLMMQCGMFVTAEQFTASVCNGVFTHFKRAEDPNLKRGKLDEELNRMSLLIEKLKCHSLMLCNESFSSTNEREGSEIARQIVRALLEADVRVLFVTHLFDLAEGFYSQGSDSALFLRAEREVGGLRTFKVREGKPLSTSHGKDLYNQLFGAPQ